MASGPAYSIFNDEGRVTLNADTQVYPNPSDGKFFIEIDSDVHNTFHVKVMNLIGKVVINQEVSVNERAPFDLTAQPGGVYFIQISVGKEQVIKRIVIR